MPCVMSDTTSEFVRFRRNVAAPDVLDAVLKTTRGSSRWPRPRRARIPSTSALRVATRANYVGEWGLGPQ
jgi:hypothetical protein